MAIRILDEPLVRLRGDRYDKWTRKTKKGTVVRLLYWGDEIDLVRLADATDPTIRDVPVRYHDYFSDSVKTGFIRKKKKPGQLVPLRFRAAGDHLLEVLFVDVQQGDGAIIRTPDRKLILVDGGEHAMFARALKSLFPEGGNPATPLDIHALIITHGDADHFKGLIHLADARDKTDHRELHAKVHNFFHNGLVKGPDSLPDGDRLGATVVHGKERYITDLWSDTRNATSKNPSFAKWNDALERMIIPGVTVVDRLEYGDDAAFDFLRSGGVDVQVLGPIVEPNPVTGALSLPFLRNEKNRKTASHTINGHSVILRLKYRNIHFLMGGDLNHDAEHRLRTAIDNDTERTLRSEVLKVPHHGSHEYEQKFLDDVNPVISVVSSGDERASQDYVHPRANLMAALGKASRGPSPLLFSTEVAAFFAHRKWINPEQHKMKNGKLVELSAAQQKPGFRAFERLVYGAVRIRTDGMRLVSAVESAHANIKEAYSMEIDSGGNVKNVEQVKPL